MTDVLDNDGIATMTVEVNKLLTIEELLRLMAALESTRVERKAVPADDKKIRQAVCAFANDLGGTGTPGYVLIGVDDKTGKPTGLKVTDQILKDLAQIRLDGSMQPTPSMTVESYQINGGESVVVVEVHPSEAPPVRLSGLVWVRPGPARGTATREEEKRLGERRVASSRPFDVRPCTGAVLADLDIDMFRTSYLTAAVAPEVLAENQRTVQDQLASLRFLDTATQVPTYAGLLVLGRDPLAFIPGGYVQFLRIDGVGLADPVASAQRFSGPLPQLLREAESAVNLNIRTARVPGEGLRMRDQPDYPAWALRELVFNAIVHRTYEVGNAPVRINWFNDRIEIQNPGGLYGQVTPENFGKTADYRNPTLAEAMKVLGFVDRYGSGISRVRASLAKNGNPEATFEFESTYLQATVRSRS